MFDDDDSDEWTSARRRPRRWRRVLGRAVLALVMAVAIVAILARHAIIAQYRAAIVVGSVTRVPVVSPLVGHVTSEPGSPRDATIGASRARVWTPRGDGPWPTVLFLTGADKDGIDSPDVARMARGLARAGYATIVPELAGLADGDVSESSLDDAARMVVGAAQLPEVAGDRLALVSVSAGTSLSLVIAARPDVSRHLSVVGGIAPYARARTVLEIATVGGWTDDAGRFEPYATEPWLRTAVTRSLARAAQSRSLTNVPGLAAALNSTDPIADLRAIPAAVLERLPSEDRAVIDLLMNTDPARFDSLYDALPADVRARIDMLSPRAVATAVNVPVELAASPHDPYFPLAETRSLVRALPHGHLVVTGALSHARPAGSVRLRDVLSLDAFAVRVLRAAAAPSL